MRTCILIPAYNEQRHIAEVVRGCLVHGLPVLVVDDCSEDATVERAREAGVKEIVRHEVNRGKGAAIATGMARARELGFDAAITLDGDGQHDPAEIPRFVECEKMTGADIIVGSRFLVRDAAGAGGEGGTPMPPSRKITNWFMSRRLSGFAGKRLTDTQSGFRLVKLDAWEALDITTSHFDMESEMLVVACRIGLTVREVPVSTIYGDEKSSIHPVRDTVRWIRLIGRLKRLGRRDAGACGTADERR